MYLDAQSTGHRFGHTDYEYAVGFVQSTAGSDLPRVGVCPVQGDSTYAETQDVRRCIKDVDVHSVLLVTSNYHTRRALSEFRKRLPQYHWTMAATEDPDFSFSWWRRRQWARTTVQEWERMLYWQLVERWGA